MASISVAIITKNEADNIARCIASVKEIADEIIVVDSYSTDQTVAIAQSLGATCILQEFLGYIEQKNFALERCTQSYILSLDADEALSKELQDNILQVKNQLQASAYNFNRLTKLGPKWIKHSGWYPDKKTRLFKKGTGKWGGTNPHDFFEIFNGGKTEHIKGDLLHYSFPSVEDYPIQSMNFAEIAAKSMFIKGKKSSKFKMFYKPLAAFFKCYFLKLGCLDLQFGLKIAVVAAKSKRVKYQRLLELNRAGEA